MAISGKFTENRPPNLRSKARSQGEWYLSTPENGMFFNQLTGMGIWIK